MKTVLYCMAALAAAVSAISIGFFMAGLPAFDPGTPTLARVPLSFRIPDDQAASGLVSADAQAAATRTLARLHAQVESGEIFLDGHEPIHGPTEPETEPLVSYSVRLTLKDGTELVSKIRRAKRAVLGDRIAECILRCMERQATLAEKGHAPKRITNI